MLILSLPDIMHEINPRETIGFAELSAKWRIGFPLLAAKRLNCLI
jgi:hypothetical protein